MPPFERRSHELAISFFAPPLRVAAVELEWPSAPFPKFVIHLNTL